MKPNPVIYAAVAVVSLLFIGGVVACLLFLRERRKRKIHKLNKNISQLNIVHGGQEEISMIEMNQTGMLGNEKQDNSSFIFNNEIYKTNVQIDHKIDEGNFGSVFTGVWGGTKVNIIFFYAKKI